MNKLFIFFLLFGFSLSSTANNNMQILQKMQMADASYQCHRSIRAFVREIYPDHVFLKDSNDTWKKSKKQKNENILTIEAEDYIKIKLPLKEYKVRNVSCSYHIETTTAIEIGISLPEE